MKSTSTPSNGAASVGDVDAMAQRMDELLSDPELARKLGLAGAELVRARFSPSEYTNTIRQIYQL